MDIDVPPTPLSPVGRAFSPPVSARSEDAPAGSLYKYTGLAPPSPAGTPRSNTVSARSESRRKEMSYAALVRLLVNLGVNLNPGPSPT